MRKFCLIVLLLACSVNSLSQSSLARAVKIYYRVNPFDRKFSAMLNNILADTGFVKTEMKKRTDSNLFFLSGYYKKFSPFDFTAVKTELRIAEEEIIVADTGKTLDTIILYQLIGVAGPGEENKLKTEKEFTRFDKRFSYDFSNKIIKEIYDGERLEATIRNYFVFGRRIPALTVAWGRMPGEENYVFILTLRLKIIENFADLPKAPDEF